MHEERDEPEFLLEATYSNTSWGFSFTCKYEEDADVLAIKGGKHEYSCKLAYGFWLLNG